MRGARPAAWRLQPWQVFLPPPRPVTLSLIDDYAGAPGRPAVGPDGRAWQNALIWGDNLAVTEALLPALEGKVDLLYMDPPFGIGDRFVHRLDPHADGAVLAFSDRWAGGMAGYLEMLLPRLVLAYRLLAVHGALYVHLDSTAAHYVKVLLDEIFGPECFQREIIWRIGWISGYKGTVKNWVRNHDVILFYTKDPSCFTFNKIYVPHLEGYKRREGKEGPGHPVDDVWNGSPADHALSGNESLQSIQIKSFSGEKTGYPTQKNESVLERIVRASSNPGDLVVDLFAGSGTTLVVAERLGRRWLGCDISGVAIGVARARLLQRPLEAPFTLYLLQPEGSLPNRPEAEDAAQQQAAAARPPLPVGWPQWVQGRPAGSPEEDGAGAMSATVRPGSVSGRIVPGRLVAQLLPPAAAAGKAAGPDGAPQLLVDGRVLHLRLPQPENVDFWAVSWQQADPGGPLEARWFSCRTRREPSVVAEASYRVAVPTEVTVVADVTASDGTTRRWAWTVRLP